MGEIYVAEDGVLGRKVAVKILFEHLARDEAVRRRFTREALAAARLSGHPNIVTIFDVGECDGRPFIVMEYLGGGTLADRARGGELDRKQLLEWLEQTAAALDYAHDQGIVHRDVKPANLLLDEHGGVHVADFGIARIVDATATAMTAIGTVLGTAGYLSPEQARGERATRASDVYSLGVVAYELLTGHRPFESDSTTDEAAAHVHEPVPPASKRGAGLPWEADAVFERVLAKDPAHRYRTAQHFVRALRTALETGETWSRMVATPVPATAAPVPPARIVQRRPRSYIPAIIAGLSLAGGAAGAVLATIVAGGDEPADRAAPPQRQTITQIRTVGGKVTTVFVTTAAERPQTAAEEPVPAAGGADISIADAIALTDQATYLMRDGRYADALPIAKRALSRLEGTGHTYEGYANYDVGKSLAMLGRCSEALPYLERRERLLGPHPDVTDAKRRCGAD